MVTISKPLSAAQVRTYHATEFRNGRDNYYIAGDDIVGTWHGQLAARMGLHGDVRDEQMARLADGRHPFTDEPMVQHQTARTYTNTHGERVTTMEHRAGWDATFSAPKSVSLTALVGGDARVAAAHRASVQVALDELEQYTQARIGRSRRRFGKFSTAATGSSPWKASPGLSASVAGTTFASEPVPSRSLSSGHSLESNTQTLKLLRFPEVRERTGLSRSTIWRFEQRGAFPKHRRISTNAVAWVEEDVADWIRSRIEGLGTGTGAHGPVDQRRSM